MDIWSMTRPALEDWFSSRGENPAKAAIMLERLYQRGLRDFSELPFAQRVISALSEEFTMELPETVARSGVALPSRSTVHSGSITEDTRA